MSNIDWVQIHYHQLPDWMKKVAQKGERIKKTHTKIFYGMPYDYKVQYTVLKDIISISYWRTTHTTKPLKIPKPGLILALICILAAGVSFVFFPLLLSFIGAPSSTLPPETNTSEIPEMGLTPVHTENITTISATIPGTAYQQSPKTVSYSFYRENTRRSLSFTTYGGLSDYFSKERLLTQSVAEHEIIIGLLENEYQDQYLHALIENIRNRSLNPDDTAKIAISLVQHIPYNRNKPYNAPMDWNYPYETLYSNRGTSADKSLLSAYLLKELGYETVLFEFPGHMAVGVKCSPEYDFIDTGYAFIETTQPTIITYIPDTYYGGYSVSANPRIIHVNEGKRVMDVRSEYQDAIKFKPLERRSAVLNQSENSEWLKISNKYDLLYTT
jgi:hypothetical protein